MGGRKSTEFEVIELLKMYQYKPTNGDLFVCQISKINAELLKQIHDSCQFDGKTLRNRYLYIGDDEDVLRVYRNHDQFFELPKEIDVYSPFPLARWSGVLGQVSGWFQLEKYRQELVQNVRKSTVNNFFVHDVMHTSFIFQFQVHYVIFDHDLFDARDECNDEALFQSFRDSLSMLKEMQIHSWPVDLSLHTTDPIYSDRHCIECLRNHIDAHYVIYVR